MKSILIACLCVAGIASAHALIINEVMSNPTGDDSGREWIELYNDSSSSVDLTSLSVSIKGGTAVAATPLQGGTTLAPGGFAIIGSVVSGATKFLQDYPSYGGLLFKASISLVNSGVTSIDIKINGATVASLPSYTAAKEGFTYSYIGGSYTTGSPTPGAENQVADTPSSSSGESAATTTDTQTVLPQMTPPSPNIVIYMPTEKTVVAGASSEFSVFSQTREGKQLSDLLYTWAFGDGGQAVGSSTKYTYVYPGRYIAQVQGVNANVSGIGRMVVRVVPPDMAITSFGSGKYGAYVEISNPNPYELDLSGWILSINGAGYPFPKNTLLSANSITRFSGAAMGFAHVDASVPTTVRILFPDLSEVTRYEPPQSEALLVTSSSSFSVPVKKVASIFKPIVKQKMVLGVATTSVVLASTSPVINPITPRTKDTRLVQFLKNLFGK